MSGPIQKMRVIDDSGEVVNGIVDFPDIITYFLPKTMNGEAAEGAATRNALSI
jgi:hypothetical protein